MRMRLAIALGAVLMIVTASLAENGGSASGYGSAGGARTVVQTTTYYGGSAGATYVARRGNRLFPRLRSRREQVPTDRASHGSNDAAVERAPAVHQNKCSCCDKCTGEPGCKCGCEFCKCNYAGKDDAHKHVSPPARHGASIDLSDTESRMVEGINRFRRSNGKGDLAVDAGLERIARGRARTMYAPHSSSVSLPGNSAENVGSARWSDGSVSTPESTVHSWEVSDGHAKCMLGLTSVNGRYVDQGYDSVGVARGDRFDVAVFGHGGENRRLTCVELPREVRLEPEFWRDFHAREQGVYVWLRMLGIVGA